MKKSKGILSCALCVLLLISVFAAVPITASAGTGAIFFDSNTGFTYEMLDEDYKTCTVKKYDGRDMDMASRKSSAARLSCRLKALRSIRWR